MRDLLLRGGLTVSLIALISGGAFAQTPPDPLSDVEGLAYEGQIGGLDVWSVPGLNELFAVTPDGRTLMRGLMFSGSGRDLGAALTGVAPSPLLPDGNGGSETLSEGQDHSHAGGEDHTHPEGDAASGFAGLAGPDTCQSPILAEMGGAAPLLIPRVGGWDAAGAGAPPTPGGAPENATVLTGTPSGEMAPTDELGLLDGAEIARNAEDALAGFSDEERRDLLLELVSQLRPATSQQEFLAGIAAWRARVDELRVGRGLSRLYTEDGTGLLPPVATATPMTTLAPTPIEVSPLPPAGVSPEASTAPERVSPVAAEGQRDRLEQTLLEDVRHNATWFSVGANNVPTVYAFIDPTCSYSAAAISDLSERVGAGELQLRVVLAPVLSQRSAGLIAGILMNEKPPLAFFDHEVALAERGRSDLEPKEFSALPAQVQAGIQRNFEMIRDYKIPGVPFFVYETAEGARVVSGAQEGLSFPGALVDPYTGTK